MADPALSVSGGQRIVWLDALRGLALFGIAQINFPSFASGAEPISALMPAHGEALARIVSALLTFFVAAKFYPVFAFLFGYGHALQRQKIAARGLAVRSILGRRYIGLLCLGVVHGLLLFFGDILTMYALAGFILLLYDDHSQSRSRSAVARWAGVSVVLAALVAFDLPSYPHDAHAAWVDLYRQDILLLDRGAWRELVQARALDYISSQLYQMVGFLPQLLMFMCAGVWAAERGVFSKPSEHRRLFWRLIGIGLVIGVPINAALTLLDREVLDEVSAPLAVTGVLEDLAFSLALGYLGLFGLYAARCQSRPAFKPALPIRWLAGLGRLALTNYITQSCLMMAIWYLGFRALERHGVVPAMALVALLVCVAQLIFSLVYLRFRQQGPLEAVWRRYTYAASGWSMRN